MAFYTRRQLVVLLILVAIADLDRPYQGSDVVQPAGFQTALQLFDRHTK